ncbi:ATPase AAA [Xenorhabdus miraniensis]|uniref:ATPase AAA n=1 Tax=Xenorhabdus miraniensis TaxID=351674 RepID=A0A2D0JJK3_9GAMM|nr:ATPase AAA [Xenorhabdus miraniensis]
MKVWIVGSPGSGKSTMSRKVASALGCKHVELDAIVWNKGWTKCDFLSANAEINQLNEKHNSIVFDGGYDQFRSTLYEVVDVVILMSVPFPISFFRVLRRSVKRVLTKEMLWNGNIETFGGITKKDGMLHYAFTQRNKIRKKNRSIYSHFEGRKFIVASKLDISNVLDELYDR